MKPVRIAIFTRTDLHDSNPGDIILGDGIRYLLKRSFPEVIFTDYDCFDYHASMIEYIKDNCDIVVIAGRPRLNPECSDYQILGFWEHVSYLKQSGLKVWDLWGGSGFPDAHMGIREYLKLDSPILQTEVQFEKNFSDLIICRDMVMYQYLLLHGVPKDRLFNMPCSSYWANADYGLSKNQKKDIELAIVPRQLPSNEWLTDTLINKFKEAIFIAHHRDEMAWGPKELLVINNPRDLLEFYNRCKKVITFRLHGAIPAYSLGAEVCHIGMDSRRYVLHNFKDNRLYTFENFRDNKELFDKLEFINNRNFNVQKYENEIINIFQRFYFK